jgi:hypothetical protein
LDVYDKLHMDEKAENFSAYDRRSVRKIIPTDNDVFTHYSYVEYVTKSVSEQLHAKMVEHQRQEVEKVIAALVRTAIDEVVGLAKDAGSELNSGLDAATIKLRSELTAALKGVSQSRLQ